MIKEGKIVCGFPGIGKSTYITKNFIIGRWIDFESSNFNKNNTEWYIDYCKCVMDLVRQGYNVFCSTHAPVVKYLSENTNINIVFPSDKIEKDWVKRLQNRYNADPSDKNKRALKFGEDYLIEAIGFLKENYSNNENINLVEIDSIDYKLEDILNKIIGVK